MDTGTRRFILRLAIGLLTFLVGIAAVWALGGLNPFQGSSETTPNYRHKRCNAYRSWNVPTPSEKIEAEVNGEIIYLKGPHGMKMKKDLDKLNRELSELGRNASDELPPPPPPPPHAPVAR